MFTGTRALTVFSTLVLAALLGAIAPAAVAAQKPAVRVDWTDPAQFTEMQYTVALDQPAPEVWLGEFASTIQRYAPRVLKTGQTLAVTITNVTLAGTVRSGARANDIRIVGQNSPPRIKLHFELTAADGQVIDSGDRNLSNTAYMSPIFANNSDTYKYEDRLLTDWMDKEFGKRSK